MNTKPPAAACAFPWGSALYASMVGLTSLFVGFAALILATDTPDVIFEFNGHTVGGPLDTLVLLLVATVCGGYGIYRVLRFRNDLAAWRSHH